MKVDSVGTKMLCIFDYTQIRKANLYLNYPLLTIHYPLEDGYLSVWPLRNNFYTSLRVLHQKSTLLLIKATLYLDWGGNEKGLTQDVGM